ncbi:hypothetical protein BD770DRAFT_406164 [Pilaira anomala]|nr:hypothetical protein BD770DRAFT_406164 [Pilaira anomala]
MYIDYQSYTHYPTLLTDPYNSIQGQNNIRFTGKHNTVNAAPKGGPFYPHFSFKKPPVSTALIAQVNVVILSVSHETGKITEILSGKTKKIQLFSVLLIAGYPCATYTMSFLLYRDQEITFHFYKQIVGK